MVSFGGPKDLEQFLKDDCEKYQDVILKSIGDNKEDSEDWLMLFMLIRILQLQDCEDEQDWYDFQKEILHNNRYFPKSRFLERVKELSPIVTAHIGAGEVLYRCRKEYCFVQCGGW